MNCCGNWAQDFSFDSFGNILASGSLSFQPSNYGNNKIQGWSLNGQPIAYNLDGDIIQDPFHTFTWFASNELDSVDSVSLVRDALGRVVEIDGSSDEQVLYAPFGGKIAEMTGSTLDQAWIPLADGAEAVYNSSGFAYYRHESNFVEIAFINAGLGSSRLATTQQRGVYFDTAYSPYGAAYDSSGTADLDFTGHNSLITNPNSSEVLSDFMFREYSSLEGRWIQPDPAGLAAVNPADPQSWNRYVYVGNQPMTNVDFLGLDNTTCQVDAKMQIIQNGGYAPPIGYNSTSNPCPPSPTLDYQTVAEILFDFIFNNPMNINNGPSNPNITGGGNGGGGFNYLLSMWQLILTPYNGPLPDCTTEAIKNIGKTAVNQVADFIRGVGEFISNGAQALSSSFFNNSENYAVAAALTVPLRSSIYRGGVELASEFADFGELAGSSSPLLAIDYAVIMGGSQTGMEAWGGQCH